ncbi:putative holin-like toxin [Pseudalkalibacillus sp. R45]|uniref:putative holin-like toxin n=1 Tax=Pseudalkalibacillus sp. R45 TaxID=3457433 RepID=UPI001C87CBF2
MIELYKYDKFRYSRTVGTTLERGGVIMTVFQTLMVTISFATLIISVLSFPYKK